jgi:hypothetical protein
MGGKSQLLLFDIPIEASVSLASFLGSERILRGIYLDQLGQRQHDFASIVNHIFFLTRIPFQIDRFQSG